MCLDWREICDGKIDCIRGNFDIDEEYCSELDITECKEDKYRCHNGAQCIPLIFFRDGRTSKNSLDGTDETEYFCQSGFSLVEKPLKSIDLMIFACEELTCRRPHACSCGDGTCLPRDPGFNLISNNSGACESTDRNAYYSQVILRMWMGVSRD
ncbi:unnamed protein product [Adineta steineri]|uniref:Uncharacterized protein n=1 Tax=Adineta steineri TaxID=433720 RepID=A0A816EEM4_9BILA|nr:unnamed protein product [Adineta steineri]CAF1509203.1 unnamed protein product [Adineta steineri]CAF1646825.1 unnamed protein product [Adineta steineri]CAF4009049.1 unnamed protein product [Adineta steineri]